MSNNYPSAHGVDGVPLRPAQCAHCGEIVKFQGFLRRVQVVRNEMGEIAYPRRSETVEVPNPRAGWSHHDGMRRDHVAEPHDGRTPEVDMERQRRGFNAARIGVKRVMQKQFDYLHAENTVNEIARGMNL